MANLKCNRIRSPYHKTITPSDAQRHKPSDYQSDESESNPQTITTSQAITISQTIRVIRRTNHHKPSRMNSIKKKRKKKLQLVSFWQTSVGYVLIASRRENAKKCVCFVSIRYDRIRGVSKLGSVGYAYPGRIAPVSRIGMGYEGKMPDPCILGNYYGDKMSTFSYLEQVLPAILDGLYLCSYLL